MNLTRQLADFESRAYQSLWTDGLLDLAVGVALFGLGVSWISDLAVLGGVLPALLVPIWYAARRRVSEPRAGYVELSDDRQHQLARSHMILTALAVVSLSIGVALYFQLKAGPTGNEGLPGRILPALPAVLVGIAMLLVAALYRVPRFLGYGLLLFVSAAICGLLGLRPGWHFVVPGVFVSCAGLYALTSFLQESRG